MNLLNSDILQKANEEAIYNIYLYLAHKTTPEKHETLRSIVLGLQSAFENQITDDWSDKDIRRLDILKNAIIMYPYVAESKITNLTRSKSGLTACSFTKPRGGVSVIFKGTGKGEWIDNGEGLSGIPEENTYITYGKDGKALYSNTIKKDYATDQQVEALNWFNNISSKNGWDAASKITVSGHSKGGNKAQFCAIHSKSFKECYSFNGHGFSPEALSALKKQYGAKYEKRRQNIFSFSSNNDYVNVLGERLMPKYNIYFFESKEKFHSLEAMLKSSGHFLPQCEQGKLSRYAETISDELMKMDSSVRQYATLGIMNVFQKYLANR